MGGGAARGHLQAAEDEKGLYFRGENYCVLKPAGADADEYLQTGGVKSPHGSGGLTGFLPVTSGSRGAGSPRSRSSSTSSGAMRTDTGQRGLTHPLI